MTNSDTYPKIQRLQGQILIPVDIEEADRPDGDGNGYQYRLVRLQDSGQNVDLPYKEFLKRYFTEIRRSEYGDVGDQLDMIFQDMKSWKTHIQAVKEQYPK